MNNPRLKLLVRARMSTLNAIRRFGDTDAEQHLKFGAMWLSTAINRMHLGIGGEVAAMENATSHLELASRVLGFTPVTLR